MTTQTSLEDYGFSRRKRRREIPIADDDKDVVQALEEDLEQWKKLQEVLDYLEEQEILEKEIEEEKMRLKEEEEGEFEGFDGEDEENAFLSWWWSVGGGPDDVEEGRKKWNKKWKKFHLKKK